MTFLQGCNTVDHALQALNPNFIFWGVIQARLEDALVLCLTGPSTAQLACAYARVPWQLTSRLWSYATRHLTLFHAILACRMRLHLPCIATAAAFHPHNIRADPLHARLWLLLQSTLWQSFEQYFGP